MNKVELFKIAENNLKEIENEKNELKNLNDSAKFWKVVAGFYYLQDGTEGTISEFIKTINSKSDFRISLSDGFLYRYIIPLFLKYGVLEPINSKKKLSYLGRYGNCYKINLKKLDEFVFKNNFLCKIIFKKRIVKGEIDLDLNVD